ncbi:MAG: hypothetical protein K8L99_28280 [Anaerolineae bacterium]|nr:hypothetical protein [Anaerolineae bacterium]
MGIKLDWEIEAEEPNAFEAGEDAVSRRRRRRARLYVLLVILGALALFAIIALVVVLRLRAVDEEVENLLIDTVDAEVATLRIGDETSFQTFQRSASPDWALVQQLVFDEYQKLKVERSVQLTGQVLDTAIDGMRARVKVEEIIDGVPYVELWFYWRYEDGWYHVPPDYTFWGQTDTLSSEHVQVQYQAVDLPVAQAVQSSAESWLQAACGIIGCDGLPVVKLEILPDQALTTGWSGEDPWLMRIPSPYLARARQDKPFDTALQLQVSNLIADRLVMQALAGVEPQYPADAYYLRAGVVSWLVQRFTGVNTNSFLISSLAQNDGEQAVGDLLKLLQPDSNVSIFTAVTGAATLEQANLDWRDFLTWRLVLEQELIARGDEAGFIALYDPAIQGIAIDRYRTGTSNVQPVVVSVRPETGDDGVFQLRAVVEMGDQAQQEAVIFRLIDGTWRRAN